MTERKELSAAFLSRTDWANAARAPLAGDASSRKYERLTNPVQGRTAVLMDEASGNATSMRAFVDVSDHLKGIGLSPPLILEQDIENGFLLIEDLGDDLFARVIPNAPELERPLYLAATDVLICLHRHRAPELAPYSSTMMAELSGLAFSRYQKGAAGEIDIPRMNQFCTLFERLLEKVTGGKQVMILRDYHAENLLWLPDRTGPARVGLLDFQDAMSGHPAYDLVSMLQDARRDVPPEIEAEMIAYYIRETGIDGPAFRIAYAVLGAQRNLRIIGVFARLCIDHGKPGYVDLIPRVWSLLMRDLHHPALADVADILKASLPEPTPEALERLRIA